MDCQSEREFEQLEPMCCPKGFGHCGVLMHCLIIFSGSDLQGQHPLCILWPLDYKLCAATGYNILINNLHTWEESWFSTQDGVITSTSLKSDVFQNTLLPAKRQTASFLSVFVEPKITTGCIGVFTLEKGPGDSSLYCHVYCRPLKVTCRPPYTCLWLPAISLTEFPHTWCHWPVCNYILM